MKLVRQHIIKKGHLHYAECDRMCFLAKNLYNQALYRQRQRFISGKGLLTPNELRKELAKENQVDFRAMPSQVAKEVLRLLGKNWKSFFAALKAYKKDPSKFLGRPRLPSYKDKLKGRQIAVFYNPEAISQKGYKDGVLKLTGTTIELPSQGLNVKQVRLVSRYGCYIAEVVYENPDVPIKAANGQYAAIDIGLNNLATVAFNNGEKPVFVDGRPLKSINQYYNKKKARLMSYIGDKGTSNRIQKLTAKRNNKVKDYLHKASTKLVNHIVSNNITKVYVGKNDGWKQGINIGKRNNQSFVSVPFCTFISQLEYKLRMKGVLLEAKEESYTSKCSFLDLEPVKKHETYMGRRVKRGLFRAANGRTINADVNAAYNIGRKSSPGFIDGIEARFPLVPVRLKT